VVGLQLVEVGPPRGDVGTSREVALRALVLEDLQQLAEHDLDVTDDRDVDGAVLADLGRVDVDVDHLGVRRERPRSPVTRSSKRAPRVTSRSVSWNAFTAA
jgi:hypothetical protein